MASIMGVILIDRMVSDFLSNLNYKYLPDNTCQLVLELNMAILAGLRFT